MKRVALINDLSGIGRCSLTVALPIVSAFGLECAVLPTALLSNHTGFDKFTFCDFTDHMREYMDSWESLGATFDMVYSGFLGSVEQIDITLEFMSRFGENAIKLVDPVMGDDGKIYTTYTKDMCEHMRRLAHAADVITPNLTELCVLCGVDYPQDTTVEKIKNLCCDFASDHLKKIVVTGLENSIVKDIPDGCISNIVYENGKVTVVTNKKVPILYCGTGDVFASVLCGAVANGMSFDSSVRKAGDFVELCTRDTYKNGGHKLYGVMFEDKLDKLI